MEFIKYGNEDDGDEIDGRKNINNPIRNFDIKYSFEIMRKERTVVRMVTAQFLFKMSQYARPIRNLRNQHRTDKPQNSFM